MKLIHLSVKNYRVDLVCPLRITVNIGLYFSTKSEYDDFNNTMSDELNSLGHWDGRPEINCEIEGDYWDTFSFNFSDKKFTSEMRAIVKKYRVIRSLRVGG